MADAVSITGGSSRRSRASSLFGYLLFAVLVLALTGVGACPSSRLANRRAA
jgi:predicted permease